MFRKMICLVSFVLVLSLVGDIQAATAIWTDTTGGHLWSTPENWSKDRLPILADAVKIGLSLGPIIVNGVAAEVQNIALGYENFTGELTMNGGTLTTRRWLMLGYDEESRGTLNMNNGVITVGSDLSVGSEGSGVLNMTGGTIVVGNILWAMNGVFNMFGGTITAEGTFSVGDQVNLDGGVITTTNFWMRANDDAASKMDIKAGTLIINSDQLRGLQRYIDNGWIIAYDGQGTLKLDYDITNEHKTTLKAVHMLNPNPIYGSNVLPGSVNQLQWTLPEPSQLGGIVTCDVYFGTNPNVEENPKIVDCQAVESVSVALASNMIYYWALNLYDSSISTTEPYMLSSIFRFNVLSQPLIVDAGADVVTWLADGLRTGNLDATVTDNGFVSPYTMQWTVISEPNDFDAVIANPSVEDTSIILTALGEYVLQLEAFDGEYTGSDTVTINVYNDSCEAAQSLPDYIPLVGDLNGDCRVDDIDLALLEENWLKDNSLIEEWFAID